MVYFNRTFLSFVLLFCLAACSGAGPDRLSQGVKNSYQTASPVTKSAVGGAVVGGVVGGVSGAGVPVGVASGALIGGVIGKHLGQKQSEVRTLQGMGVYFIHLGDNVLVVIPSDLLFIGYSERFDESAYDTLGLVRAILSGMTKVGVKVAAYTPNAMQRQSDILLTELQAVKVSSYLFSDNNAVDARFIYAKGYGSGHPIDNEQDVIERSNINYRVEITLKDLSKAQSER